MRGDERLYQKIEAASIMTTTDSSLGLRAYEHLSYLTQEIGPRPAGSLAENRTQDYIAGQLQG